MNSSAPRHERLFPLLGLAPWTAGLLAWLALAGCDRLLTEKSANLPQEGVVGHWALDEHDGTEAGDQSGHGHRGQLHGNARWSPGSGRFDGAVEFEDGSFVDIASSEAFDLTNALTLALWFKVDTFQLPWQTLVAKGSAWSIQRYKNTSQLAFQCLGLGSVQTRSEVADGQWHHVAGVFNGHRLLLYLDGVLEAALPVTGQISLNASNIHLGDNPKIPGRQFLGSLDDVLIYQRALGPLEIAVLRRERSFQEPDRTAPQLDFSSVRLRGKVFDASGVSSFRINDRDVLLTPDGTWEVEVALPLQEQDIRIHASDSLGNASDSEWTLR